jgi:hypothetical protein
MTIRSAIVCLFLGLSASGCGSGSGFGEKYRFSDNEVPGWTQTPAAQDSAAYGVYTGGEQLVGRIDGGDVYTSRGCRVSMYQDLTGPYPEICTVVAMDFVTNDNATGMFTYQQQTGGASASIPGYGASDAIGSSFALGGQTVFAHVKASYFEVQLSGFVDATSTGAAAKQFLDVLKSKTN